MKTHAIRLMPGQDLRKELFALAKKKRIEAGFVITCVGSLKEVSLRVPSQKIKSFKQNFEIVSMVGTFSPNDGHIHISLSDDDGNVIGGHLKEGCIVHTTAEIVIAETDEYTFSRRMDEETRFEELQIQ